MELVKNFFINAETLQINSFFHSKKERTFPQRKVVRQEQLSHWMEFFQFFCVFFFATASQIKNHKKSKKERNITTTENGKKLVAALFVAFVLEVGLGAEVGVGTEDGVGAGVGGPEL